MASFAASSLWVWHKFTIYQCPDFLIIGKFLAKNESEINQGTVKSSLKVEDTPKKFSSCLNGSTDQKWNVNEQNPKLNIGRESTLSSTKQVSTQVDKAINQCPKPYDKKLYWINQRNFRCQVSHVNIVRQ